MPTWRIQLKTEHILLLAVVLASIAIYLENWRRTGRHEKALQAKRSRLNRLWMILDEAEEEMDADTPDNFITPIDLVDRSSWAYRNVYSVFVKYRHSFDPPQICAIEQHWEDFLQLRMKKYELTAGTKYQPPISDDLSKLLIDVHGKATYGRKQIIVSLQLLIREVEADLLSKKKPGLLPNPGRYAKATQNYDYRSVTR